MKYLIIACIFLIYSEVYAMFPYYTGDGYVYMADGEQAIDEAFSFAAPFKNGFAIVEKDGKAGVINAEGKFIIKAEFDRIISLSDEITCFKAINYYTEEKSRWTIFGTSRWSEERMTAKLYDASGKSFYKYDGRVEFDPVTVFGDRIFVIGKYMKVDVFEDNGNGRIKLLKTLKRAYVMHPIVDRNKWFRTEGDPDKDLERISLCTVDTNECSTEYTLVENTLGGVIKDSAGRYFMLRDGLEEVTIKDGTVMLTSLLSPAQRESLQQLPDGLKMDWNRPFEDGSVVLRNNEAAFYISPDGEAYSLPLHSRVSYIAPDTLLLTNTIFPEDDESETRWEFCIYSPVDGVFVLPWQKSSLHTLGKSRDRFVKESDGLAVLIDRQGNAISAEYKSITTTNDPKLYLADDVYIFAKDGKELRHR